MVRRLCTVAGIAGFILVAGSTPAMAHGAGGRLDLGVPVGFFAAGVAAVLVGAFMAATVRWTAPRFRGGRRARALEGPGERWILLILRFVGLVAFGIVVIAGLFDGNDGIQNIAPVTFWVGGVLVVPLVSAGAGNIWRPLSPFRAITGWVNRNRPERVDLLDKIGMWPAAAVLLIFFWLQLVYPNPTKPITVGVVALVYLGWLVAVTRLVGVETGHELGGAFHHSNRLISGIAPLRIEGPDSGGTNRRPVVASVGSIRRDGWLRGLPNTVIRPGLVGFVITMIGGVAYDGLAGTTWWGDLWGATAGTVWFGTIALVTTVLALSGAYLLAARTVGRLAASDRATGDLAAAFAHTLVPVALGYSVAHYFTFVVFDGQQILHAASDPFGYGWNLFGTAAWRVEFWLSATAVWYIQVALILVSHLAAVLLTYDGALAEFGEPDAGRSQYAMLVFIVLLASLALFVLAG